MGHVESGQEKSWFNVKSVSQCTEREYAEYSNSKINTVSWVKTKPYAAYKRHFANVRTHANVEGRGSHSTGKGAGKGKARLCVCVHLCVY